MDSSEALSPRSPERQCPSQAAGRRRRGAGGRLSLRMRQVESIREPEEDSDHESVVLEDAEGLFGLLLPIREVDRESRLGDSRVGSRASRVGSSASRDDETE